MMMWRSLKAGSILAAFRKSQKPSAPNDKSQQTPAPHPKPAH